MYSNGGKGDRELAPKKTAPDWVDLKMMYLLGRGYSVVESAVVMGSSNKALFARIARLYQITGTETQSQLMYWMLSEDKFHYPSMFSRRRLDSIHTEIVQLLVEGYYREDIQKKLILSSSMYDKRLKVAKNRVNARTNLHLVAICYTEDWII